MRRLLLLLVLASQCHGAVAFIQHFNNSTGIHPALSGVASGNLLILGVTVFSASNTVTAVTDSSGDTWVHGTSCLAPANGSMAEVPDFWYDSRSTGATSGTHTLTLTITGGSGDTFDMMEVSGQNQASPFDLCATGQGTSTNPSVSITPSASGEALFAYMVSSSAPTVGAGFTFTTNSPVAANFNEAMEYKLSASGGAQSAAFGAGLVNYSMTIIAINPSGGAPAVMVPRKKGGWKS